MFGQRCFERCPCTNAVTWFYYIRTYCQYERTYFFWGGRIFFAQATFVAGLGLAADHQGVGNKRFGAAAGSSQRCHPLLAWQRYAMFRAR
jgi:hypothetical protein